MYPNAVQNEAISLLLAQIGSFQTDFLVRALAAWNPVEVRLFLGLLVGIFAATIIPKPSIQDHNQNSPINSYLSALPSHNEHSLLPFIEFLQKLCQVSTVQVEAVLESCSLDLLFRLYVTDFRDCLTRTGANRSGHDRKSSLLTACNSLLITMCHVRDNNTSSNDSNSSKAGVMSFIQRHPFYNLWSVHPAIFSSRSQYLELVQHSATSARYDNKLDLDSKRLLERREAWYAIALDSHPKRWKVGNMHWVCWRISSIYDMMADYSRASLYENGLHHVAFDAFVDLMEFIGISNLSNDLPDDLQIPFRALRSLHRLLCNLFYWPVFNAFMLPEHLPHAKEVFGALMGLLNLILDNKAHLSFFFPSDPSDFGLTVVVHFIHWFTRASTYTQALTRRRFKSFHPFFLNLGCLELIKRTIRALDELESISIHPDRESQDRQDGFSPSNNGDPIDHNPQYRRSLLNWAVAVFSYTSATDVDDVDDILEILGNDEPGEETDTDILNIPLRPNEVSDWELTRSVVDPENIDELYEWIEDWLEGDDDEQPLEMVMEKIEESIRRARVEEKKYGNSVRIPNAPSLFLIPITPKVRSSRAAANQPQSGSMAKLYSNINYGTSSRTTFHSEYSRYTDDTSSSMISTTTASASTSTIVGPGSLSGRAVLALGKLTLKGVERVIIARRLSTISSNFPHSNASGTRIKGLKDMYADLLELSRVDMYPNAVQDEAISLLLTQIGSFQTDFLVHTLAAWNPVEVRLFLGVLIGIFAATIIPKPSTQAHSRNSPLTSYLSASPSHNEHSLLPFIEFLQKLCQVSTVQVEAVLESGSLDLLYRLYVTDFRDCLTRTGANRSGHDRKSSLLTACNSFLITICHVGNNDTGSNDNNSSKAAVMSFIRKHPFYSLWSVHPAVFYSRSQYLELVQRSATSSRYDNKPDLDSKRLLERSKAWYAIALNSHDPERWKVGNMRWVCWRISSIYDMMADYSRAPLYEYGLHYVAFDAFVDLMEFIGIAGHRIRETANFSNNLSDDLQIPFRALRSLHRLLCNLFYWPVFNAWMLPEHLPHAKEVFGALMGLLNLILDHQAHSSFFFSSDPSDFEVTVVVHFIHWFTRASTYTQALTRRRSKSFRPFFLNLGCLELIKRTIRALDELESVSIHLGRDQRDSFSPNDSDHDQIARNPQYRRNLLNWAIAVFSYTNVTDVDNVDGSLEILGDDELGEEPDTDIMNIPLRPKVSDWELTRSVVDPENVDELYEWIEDWC
ncbi:hypothetical protein K435DRAFT_857802 [Dendrothele bispora CBS 962.96]|uniref:Uncharacterized protein n=1 Tax=Dendrothele bispora (strain CBS 962.96) TaxID=1314807 RepID=A0A4S8M691_DENBC|nr:hypothetical protein K435DRAFT_857802 [Dendrothele bispora CBS 962.96]